MQPQPDINQLKRLNAWSKVDTLVNEVLQQTHNEVLTNRLNNSIAELVRVCVDTRTAEYKRATGN